MRQYDIYTHYMASGDEVYLPLGKNAVGFKSTIMRDDTVQKGAIDYSVNDSTGTLSMLFPLEEGEVVTAYTDKQSNKPLKVFGYGKSKNPNAIFQRYGTDAVLANSTAYEACVVVKGEEYKFSFDSKLEPMFAKSNIIMKEIGEFIPDYSAKDINDVLYNNSKEVYDLVEELKADDIQNVTIEVSADGIYSSNDKAVKDWVKYKTEIDLIYARYFGISLNYGSISKKIGDIQVTRDKKLPYLDNLLSRLKKLFDEADQTIRGVDTVKWAVKGIDNYTYDSWARETTW